MISLQCKRCKTIYKASLIFLDIDMCANCITLNDWKRFYQNIKRENNELKLAFDKRENKLKELKEDNMFLIRQEKNTDARIERLLRKLTKNIKR